MSCDLINHSVCWCHYGIDNRKLRKLQEQLQYTDNRKLRKLQEQLQYTDSASQCSSKLKREECSPSANGLSHLPPKLTQVTILYRLWSLNIKSEKEEEKEPSTMAEDITRDWRRKAPIPFCGDLQSCPSQSK